MNLNDIFDPAEVGGYTCYETGKVWQAYYVNSPGTSDRGFYGPRLETE